jgi:hypothetical protein
MAEMGPAKYQKQGANDHDMADKAFIGEPGHYKIKIIVPLKNNQNAYRDSLPGRDSRVCTILQIH